MHAHPCWQQNIIFLIAHFFTLLVPFAQQPGKVVVQGRLSLCLYTRQLAASCCHIGTFFGSRLAVAGHCTDDKCTCLINTGFYEYSAMAKERAHLKIFASLTVTYSINGLAALHYNAAPFPLLPNKVDYICIIWYSSVHGRATAVLQIRKYLDNLFKCLCSDTLPTVHKCPPKENNGKGRGLNQEPSCQKSNF